MRKLVLRLALPVWAMTLGAPLALAQSYPSKPIRIVTQFAPGASGDTSLRVITPTMAQDLGQPVVIDNRAGGGGMVAAELVARAPGDGYTLLGGTSATQIIRPFITRERSFDPVKDFTPITALYTTVTLLVTNPSLGISTPAELIDYARRNPGKLAYGTSGIGTDHHLNAELISQLAGIRLLHVPYKASAQALIDVVSGQLPMTFAISGAAGTFVRNGKVRAVAVIENRRSTLFPDVPAMSEVLPRFQAVPSWNGMFGPAGVPAAIVARLHASVVKALRTPEAVARWETNGYEIVGNTPEAFAQLMREQLVLVEGIVKAAGIQPE